MFKSSQCVKLANRCAQRPQRMANGQTDSVKFDSCAKIIAQSDCNNPYVMRQSVIECTCRSNRLSSRCLTRCVVQKSTWLLSSTQTGLYTTGTTITTEFTHISHAGNADGNVCQYITQWVDFVLRHVE